MDGKGRWVDNVIVERRWRSVKYEDVYVRAYDTPVALRTGLTHDFQFYNAERRHPALNRETPMLCTLQTPRSNRWPNDRQKFHLSRCP